MKPSSRKNIHPVLSDVKHPKLVRKEKESNKTTKESLFKRHRQEAFTIKKSPFRYVKVSILVTLLLVIIAISSYAFYLWSYKDDALISVLSIYENFKAAAYSLISLENDSAEQSLDKIDNELEELNQRVELLSILPILKEIPKIIGQVKNLTDRLRTINNDVEEIKVNGFNMIFNGEGEKFLATLKNLRSNAVAITTTVADLRNKASEFGALPDEMSADYLVLNTNAKLTIDILDAFIALLEKPGESHFILLFENPSEMRPGGGFAGSYGDLVLERGNVKEIDVNDIYYPDKFLDLKIIPPKHLQGITSGWGARDANWFFNFPDSAEKILYLLESSIVYKDEGIKFEGLIAVNVRVIEDILEIVGPIEMPEYDLILNAENFLREVQWEVESGRDKKPGQDPKKILSVITPKLMDKLSELSDSEKKYAVNIFNYRLANKDIKFYFRDGKMQSMASSFETTGEVFEIPASFNGDYLAVVNTNIAGGKTDAFISQKVELISHLDALGAATNTLTVSRTHSGNVAKESWYRTVNQNFIKIFTLPNVRLLSIDGNTSKIINPLLDYNKRPEYQIDPDVEAIESTKEFIDEFDTSIYKESKKDIFATWFNIPAGSSKELTLNYISGRKIKVADGLKYSFVLDKQSGVESGFDYTIEAPSGFIWKEANSSIYRYQTEFIPARLIINLTLKKAN